MPTTRPFAYNTGPEIPLTTQVGDLAIGYGEVDYSSNYGGVQWWMGPDEDLGYVIAKPIPSGNQPNPFDIPAYVGFERSEVKTEESFLSLVRVVFGQTFETGNQALIWLNTNGYWTSFVQILPTPTPSITPTQTLTPSVTPTNTLTPTNTPSVTPTKSTAVTFSQTFTGGVSPGTTIENAWTTFRSQLTGTYTKFDFTSSNGQGYTGITDAVKVQQIADAIRTGTGGISFNTTISGVTWFVGCCACRGGTASNDAVEFANVGLCSGSSTAALRPFINNLNWGGIGSTVGASTQTLTLKFY